ncbi:hypothetical protein B0H13DRAFT_2050737 [Mycena leptocephala]|nr:hypothetical protein B0H13DRAFT_2050737 [Mycena leptocephala]
MARFAALFCAVAAAASSAAAAAVQEHDSALITFFTDRTQIAIVQYLGQGALFDTVPTGCIPLGRRLSPVSSVQIAKGIQCTLWKYLNGNVPNLVYLEFNDLVCMATFEYLV